MSVLLTASAAISYGAGPRSIGAGPRSNPCPPSFAILKNLDEEDGLFVAPRYQQIREQTFGGPRLRFSTDPRNPNANAFYNITTNDTNYAAREIEKSFGRWSQPGLQSLMAASQDLRAGLSVQLGDHTESAGGFLLTFDLPVTKRIQSGFLGKPERVYEAAGFSTQEFPLFEMRVAGPSGDGKITFLTGYADRAEIQNGRAIVGGRGSHGFGMTVEDPARTSGPIILRAPAIPSAFFFRTPPHETLAPMTATAVNMLEAMAPGRPIILSTMKDVKFQWNSKTREWVPAGE